jgi:hypothetical protein
MATKYQISDPINRALALGYTPAPSVRKSLFPNMEMDIEVEKLIDFGSDKMDAETGFSAEDEDISEIVAHYTNRDILIRHRMLRAKVDYFKAARARSAQVDLEASTLLAVMHRLENGAELFAANLATIPGNYGINTQALAGTDQFNHASSEPVDMFLEAHEAIEAGTLGRSPDIAIMSSDVARTLKHHPAIYAALGLGDTVRRSLSDAELAQAMNVRAVEITSHRYLTSAGVTTRSWDNILIFAYAEFGGRLDGAPTFGVNAIMKGTPFVGPWLDMGNRKHGRDAKVIQSETPQILTPLAGYLFTNCLA